MSDVDVIATPTQVSGALAKAASAFQSNNLAEATAICTRILGAMPDQFDALHMLGLVEARRGRFEESLRLFGKALAVDSRSARAHYDIGNVLLALGRTEQALASYDAALALAPDSIDTLYNRAAVLGQLKRLDEALASYDRVLAIEPRDVEALNNRGILLRQMGRIDEALSSYERALAIRPNYFEALSNYGNALHSLKRHAEALASHDKALALAPGHPVVLYNRGNALLALGRTEAALTSYERALAAKPDYADALAQRGYALFHLGRRDEALASCDKALAIKPDSVEILNNRGNLLAGLNRFDAALASFDKALALDPHHAEALHNRGNTLQRMHRMEEALASYDRELSLRPDCAEALAEKGNVLRALKRPQEALAQYARALAIDPDCAFAHFGEACCRLATGDYDRGWEKYEWRHEHRRRDLTARVPPRDLGKPLWRGEEDTAGRTILLHHEQGFGDVIQFCRYAELAAPKFARVILEVQPALKSLMASLRGPRQVIGRGEPLPDFDLQCPIGSLPLAFKTTFATIPATVPYLAASPAGVEKWQARLPAKNGPRVGLVWSGSMTDPNRTIGLRRLVPILQTGITFVSLQKDLQTEDRKLIADHGIVHHELDADFADTAAAISLMDLVISIDTAVAHLAGAMGKPLWILLPFVCDWRWGMGGEVTPWYPTARLFRQPSIGDWGSVVSDVKQTLDNFLVQFHH
jgi:tetratricopeptide (TPR) repeat protein